MSVAAAARGVQEPSTTVVPAAAFNDWADVRDLCAGYGLVLDGWQCRVLEAGLGQAGDGRWSATRVGLSVSRQSGKTAVFEARELAGLLLFDEELIIHSAHLVQTALEGFQRIKAYFENFDDLRRKVRRVREANGEQAVEMMSGQRLMFRARARGGGRGMSPDVLMLDEAQILPERAWSAVLPSLSARPNFQAWLAGTPPGPDDEGETFTRLRRAALDGSDGRLAWLEWAAARDADPSDPVSWAAANPGLGIRIEQATIEDEFNSMSGAAFATERLGIWPEHDVHERVIAADSWSGLLVVDPPPQDAVPVALAVDASHDRVLAIAACWLMDTDGTRPHVELVALDRVADTLGATEWLVERARRRIPVVVDAASPAAAMIPALKQRRVNVVTTGPTDMGKACGMFYDDVHAGRLTHAGQVQLDQAVAGAKRRSIRDAGAWGWDRRDGTVNIAPLVSVTLARFGAAVTKRRATGQGRTGSRREAVVM